MIVLVAVLRTALHFHHSYKLAAPKNPQFIDYVGKVR